MKNKFKGFLQSMWGEAMTQNKKNIFDFLEKNNKAFFIDLGCDDGTWTKKLAKKIGTRNIFGLDYINEQLKKANKIGVKATKGDLNEKFPLKSNYFDVVHSNQVIEHLVEIDNYISEIYRILKPGGYAVISTENLSSWHNIFALFMGWQAFSQHISKKYHVGNPLYLQFGEDFKEGWTHNIIFTFYGLQEVFKKFGFIVEEARGSGYYPLPGVLAKIDPRHSHFIAIKFRKLESNKFIK